jgi:hypothetical protein
MIGFWLAAVAGCSTAAGLFHHAAFAPSLPAGQAYVVAFTQDASAKVFLRTQINPSKPWRDSLKIDARLYSGGPAKWLLVIQCPTGKSGSKQNWLYSEAVQQQPISGAPVTYFTGTGPAKRQLGCFHHMTTDASITRVVLPGLETDSAIGALEQRPTAVYLARANRAQPMDVLQVFPNCPSPGEAGSAPVPSPSVAASASAGTPTSTGPSTGCDSQAHWHVMSAAYYLPAGMQTQEVLRSVDLAGAQIESAFPAPEITTDHGGTGQNPDQKYTWDGLSSLLPSFVVTNIAGTQDASRYAFDDGIAFGLLGAALIALFDKLWDLFVDWRKSCAKAKKKAAKKSRRALAHE